MRDALSTRLKFAAVASLAVSLSLATLPFIAPSIAIVPLALANWCLFLVVTYFVAIPLPRLGSFSTTDMTKLKVWVVVFLAFTIASWTAFATSSN